MGLLFFSQYKVLLFACVNLYGHPLASPKAWHARGNRITFRYGIGQLQQRGCESSRGAEQSVYSVFESYRVSLSACQTHPGSEAMTGDIRYVSPITQTVCKEYSVLRQGK